MTFIFLARANKAADTFAVTNLIFFPGQSVVVLAIFLNVGQIISIHGMVNIKQSWLLINRAY